MCTYDQPLKFVLKFSHTIVNRYETQNKEVVESAYCGGGKYLGMISGFAGAAAAAAAAAAVLQQAAAAESTWATSFHHHHPHPHYHHHPSPSKGVFLTFFKT